MDKINFIDIAKQKRDLVWPIIEDYLDQDIVFPKHLYKKDYSDIINFHKAIASEYSKRKGKYIRPTLLMLTANAMGAKDEHSKRIAAAMQLSEDWILVHDDWEDKSLARRGGPTLHTMYSPELAINAGDFVHTVMWKIIFDTKMELGAEKMFELFNEFQTMLRQTVLGQTVEIKWFEDRAILDDDDWYFIADGKISYYTIAGPLRLGALVANASKDQLDLLMQLGYLVGRGFQIRDDYLDLTSDFEGQKDQQGNDIYEGKRTLMLGHLLRTASTPDVSDINTILSKNRDQKTPQEVAWIISKMHDYGSLTYAQEKATSLATEAEKLFDEKLAFLKEEPARSYLRAGIRFMVERTH